MTSLRLRFDHVDPSDGRGPDVVPEPALHGRVGTGEPGPGHLGEALCGDEVAGQVDPGEAGRGGQAGGEGGQQVAVQVEGLQQGNVTDPLWQLAQLERDGER